MPRMQLTLSWDLFVIVFFAIIVTYSLIIGRHESLKILIGSYIAMVAAQGIGSLLERLSGDSSGVLNMMGIVLDLSILSTIKVVVFVVIIIGLAVSGGFRVEYQRESNTMVDTLFTFISGFLTAGLLLATLMTFVADVPLLDPTITAAPSIASVVAQSSIVATILAWQDAWFALPALLLLVIGFMTSDDGE